MRVEENPHVLALFPSTHGVAYVLFEGPTSLLDFGVKSVPGPVKNERSLEFVRSYLDRCEPDVIVIENTSDPASRRNKRIRMLHRSLHILGCTSNIDVEQYTRAEVAATFASLGASTKHGRSRAVASMLPALSHRLPPFRKAWMSEDRRMSLFEAAALGLTLYRNSK